MVKSTRRINQKKGTRKNGGLKNGGLKNGGLKNGGLKNGGLKNGGLKNDLQHFEQEVVVKFLQMLNIVKLFHWKTHSYATHKATDELYTNLNANIDSFVEVLLGKHGDRVNLTHVKHIPIKDFTSQNDFKKELESFKNYLVALNDNKALKSMSNSDLYNIRDEILANLNQILYLLTFK
jgi:DNA-binding ferritin-like protein